MNTGPDDTMALLLAVQKMFDEAVKEIVRAAVRNALTEATAGLERRIIDGLSYPKIETRVGVDGSRELRISFKEPRDG